MTYAENGSHAHYVTARDGSRFALLHGPHPTKEEAERHVDAVRDAAVAISSDAWFYSFGTSRVTVKPGREARTGQLNHRVITLPDAVVTLPDQKAAHTSLPAILQERDPHAEVVALP